MKNLLLVLITFLMSVNLLSAQSIREMRFENVKLETVVKALSQVSNMNIILDPGISGELQKTVSVAIYRPISVGEALNIILKEYGLIAVPVDRMVYRITKAAEASISVAGLTDGQVNQLIDSLKARLSPSAEIVVDRTLGVVYIRDEEKSIKRLESFLKDFRAFVEKVAPPAKVEIQTRVFYLKNIGIEEAMQIISKYKTPNTLITPVQTFNALVITDTVSNLSKYEELLANFLTDKPREKRPVTKIFYLKYISPDEFIKLIEPLRSEAGVVLSGGAFVQQRQTQPQQQAQQQTTTTQAQVSTPILKEFNAVMITDFPEVIDKIKERFSEYISEAPVRVLIEARIIEASEEVSRQLGISWNLILSDTQVPLSIKGAFGSNVGVGALPPWWNNPGLSLTPGSIAVFQFQKGILNALNLRLSAFERIGKTRSLSKPSVMTINGQKATIKQGLEIPYRTTAVGAGGTAVPTIQFKEVVLQLDVTPIVSPDGRVLLDINLKKDVPLDVGVTEPPLRKNEVSTKLIVEDGQTVVIGGVIDNSSSQTNEGLPGAIRVPILKWVFGQESKRFDDRELLIFITPIVLTQ